MVQIEDLIEIENEQFSSGDRSNGPTLGVMTDLMAQTANLFNVFREQKEMRDVWPLTDLHRSQRERHKRTQL